MAWLLFSFVWLDPSEWSASLSDVSSVVFVTVSSSSSSSSFDSLPLDGLLPFLACDSMISLLGELNEVVLFDKLVRFSRFALLFVASELIDCERLLGFKVLGSLLNIFCSISCKKGKKIIKII